MKRIILAGLLALTATAPAASKDLATLEPADAIAFVNTARGGVRARFAMTVRAVGRESAAVYLNSDVDHRSPGNVTFQLPPGLVRDLERKAGAPLSGIVGRRVVVDGILSNLPIYRIDHGRPQVFLRMQHTVKLRRAAQIVAVE